MSSLVRTADYDPSISAKALFGYLRAVGEFTKTRAPRLQASSFAKLEAADQPDLPPIEPFGVDGGRLAFRHYEAATSRRALVLIHGSACYGDQFQTLARLVSRWDMAQVYTVDMRGHGASEGPRGHAVARPDQLVDDIADFIAHVREAVDAESVVLGGHSAGGGLVLGAARRHPDAADAYLFLAPYLGLGGPASRPHFGGWVKLRILPLLAVAAANLFGVSRFNNTTVLDFDPAACARDGRYVRSWSFNTLMAFGPGRWIPRATPIPDDRPVLVLAGAGDECFDNRSYRDAFDVVAPHAETPEVGACGHWDLLVDVKAVSLIGAWLARRPGKHRTDSRSSASRKKRA